MGYLKVLTISWFTFQGNICPACAYDMHVTYHWQVYHHYREVGGSSRLKGLENNKPSTKSLFSITGEISRVMYTPERNISQQKLPNLSPFWDLTPECKVRLPWPWSHFVGLLKPQPLNSIRMLPKAIRILNNLKAFKFEINSFKVLLMHGLTIH